MESKSSNVNEKFWIKGLFYVCENMKYISDNLVSCSLNISNDYYDEKNTQYYGVIKITLEIKENIFLYNVNIFIEDDYNEDIWEFLVEYNSLENVIRFKNLSGSVHKSFEILSRYYDDSIEICSILPILFKNIDKINVHINDKIYEYIHIKNRLYRIKEREEAFDITTVDIGGWRNMLECIENDPIEFTKLSQLDN